MIRRCSNIMVACVLCVGACGAERSDDPIGGGGGPGTDEPAPDGEDPDGGGLRLDTPEGEGGGGDEGGKPAGCENVDFLFVVDNSGSMGDDQQNLANSFPSFIATIESTIEAQDYHVMVVDTGMHDYYEELLECQQDCAGGDEDCDVPGLGDLLCGMIPEPGECNIDLGAGRIHDAGAPPAECGIEGDSRYMVDGQGDVAGVFNCLALVGTDGDGSELPIQSMLNAVSPQLNDSGGCNEGFVRDDAILVVTLITDEEEEAGGGSPGDPAGWKEGLIAAKKGNEAAIVMLGLISDGGTPGAICPPPGMFGGGGEPSPRLRQFVESFGDRGVLGSVCEPDYSAFFQRAVEVIDFACDEFQPQG